VLIAAGLDGFVERVCGSLYAPLRGRPSLPPGRYFRMPLVGYFEGIDSDAACNGGVPTACHCAREVVPEIRTGG
jgi:hypothetical protein